MGALVGPERSQHSTYITDFKMTAIALLHAAYRNLQGFRVVVDSVLKLNNSTLKKVK